MINWQLLVWIILYCSRSLVFCCFAVHTNFSLPTYIGQSSLFIFCLFLRCCLICISSFNYWCFCLLSCFFMHNCSAFLFCLLLYLFDCILIFPIFWHHYNRAFTLFAIIKMSSSESWGQNYAACMHVFRPTQPLQWVIYMDNSSKLLKCCNITALAAITEFLQT